MHLTTLQDATFQTGSTHGDVSCLDCPPHRSARDGMTPLPRLKLRDTDITGATEGSPEAAERRTPGGVPGGVERL
jgi:hypothetical protein